MFEAQSLSSGTLARVLPPVPFGRSAKHELFEGKADLTFNGLLRLGTSPGPYLPPDFRTKGHQKIPFRPAWSTVGRQDHHLQRSIGG
jgi:hypothetical protein